MGTPVCCAAKLCRVGASVKYWQRGVILRLAELCCEAVLEALPVCLLAWRRGGVRRGKSARARQFFGRIFTIIAGCRGSPDAVVPSEGGIQLPVCIQRNHNHYGYVNLSAGVGVWTVCASWTVSSNTVHKRSNQTVHGISKFNQ